MGKRFTAEELYVIERDADLASGIASRNIYKLAETFMILRNTEKIPKKLLKSLVKEMDEHYISSATYRSIRSKCEELRKCGHRTSQDV